MQFVSQCAIMIICDVSNISFSNLPVHPNEQNHLGSEHFRYYGKTNICSVNGSWKQFMDHLACIWPARLSFDGGILDGNLLLESNVKEWPAYFLYRVRCSIATQNKSKFVQTHSQGDTYLHVPKCGLINTHSCELVAPGKCSS